VEMLVMGTTEVGEGWRLVFHSEAETAAGGAHRR
jgi:hypothetical protein